MNMTSVGLIVFFALFMVGFVILMIAVIMDWDTELPIYVGGGLIVLSLFWAVAMAVWASTMPSFEDQCRDAGGSYVDIRTDVCYDSDRNEINVYLKPL